MVDKTERQKLLDLASQYVHKDRSSVYGTPERNFEDIAKIYEVIFDRPVSPEQVALTMLAVKISRLAKSPQHYDSWVDIAGYAACGGEIAVGTQAELDECCFMTELKMSDELAAKLDSFQSSIDEHLIRAKGQASEQKKVDLHKPDLAGVDALMGIFGLKRLEE